MFELVINKLILNNRTGKYVPSGEKIRQTFNSGVAMAAFYDKQRGRSIEREFDAMHDRIERGLSK